MEEKSYWFITVMEKIEKDPRYLYRLGATRCWGFYSNKQDALDALHTNATDMWETVYDYAVLEEYYEGICGYGEYRQYFKYDQEKDGYFEIETPDFMKGYGFFSIG